MNAINFSKRRVGYFSCVCTCICSPLHRQIGDSPKHCHPLGFPFRFPLSVPLSVFPFSFPSGFFGKNSKCGFSSGSSKGHLGCRPLAPFRLPAAEAEQPRAAATICPRVQGARLRPRHHHVGLALATDRAMEGFHQPQTGEKGGVCTLYYTGMKKGLQAS